MRRVVHTVRTLWVAALLVATLALSACVPGPAGDGGDAPSSDTPFSDPTSSSRDRHGTDNSPATPRSDFKLPTAPATVNPNAAGLLQKKIGELAGVVSREDANTRLVNFVVASIKVDYHCEIDGDVKPSNGHFIAVELWIETTNSLATAKDPYFSVSAKDFDLQGPDGKKVTAQLDTRAAHACLDNGLGLPAKIGPAQKIKGLLVLDSPVNAGALILSQANTDGPGWIWQLPGK